MKNLRIIVKNAGIVLVSIIIVKICNYMFRLVSSRSLGTEGYGEFVLSLAVFEIFATIALFGIPLGITRYVSYYLSKNKKRDAASIIKTGTAITLGLSIILSIVMLVYSKNIANLINHPEIATLIKMFAFGLPFFSLLTCVERALYGLKQMKYAVLANNTLHLVKLLGVILFLALGLGGGGVVLSYVAGILISSVVVVYFLEKKVFPVMKEGIVNFVASRTLLKYSWPLIVAEVATPIISWTDSILLGYFFSTAEVGVYDISMKTAALLLIIFTSFNTIVFPVMSQHVARNNKIMMKRDYQISTTWILTLTLPIIMMFFTFPKQILTLLYGLEFSKGSVVFVLLTFAYLVTVLTGPMGAMELSLGRTKMSMFNVISTAVLNLVLNLQLIPTYGMTGAGIASMISLVYIALLRTGEIFYLTGIQPFNKRFVKPIGSAIFSMAILLLVLAFLPTIRASYVIPISIGYLLIYTFFLLFVFKLDKEEMSVIRQFFGKMRTSKNATSVREGL